MFSAFSKSNSTLPSLFFLRATIVELLLVVGRFGTPSMLVMVACNSNCGDKLSFLLVEGISLSLLDRIESPSELLQPFTKEKFLYY
jgi:hypothetical protein